MHYELAPASTVRSPLRARSAESASGSAVVKLLTAKKERPFSFGAGFASEEEVMITPVFVEDNMPPVSYVP